MARKPKNANIDIRKRQGGSTNRRLSMGCSTMTISSLWETVKERDRELSFGRILKI